eukprot:761845-Hanusia_phi.AAC.2
MSRDTTGAFPLYAETCSGVASSWLVEPTLLLALTLPPSLIAALTCPARLRSHLLTSAPHLLDAPCLAGFQQANVFEVDAVGRLFEVLVFEPPTAWGKSDHEEGAGAGAGG